MDYQFISHRSSVPYKFVTVYVKINHAKYPVQEELEYFLNTIMFSDAKAINQAACRRGKYTYVAVTYVVEEGTTVKEAVWACLEEYQPTIRVQTTNEDPHIKFTPEHIENQF